MPEPYAYSVPQLARIWGVSERTVYALVSSRKLGHLRIGSSIRIRQADRDAYEAEAWNAPEPEPSTSSPSAEVVPIVPSRGRLAPGDAFRLGQRMAAKIRGS